jgi:hypothetical protein
VSKARAFRSPQVVRAIAGGVADYFVSISADQDRSIRNSRIAIARMLVQIALKPGQPAQTDEAVDVLRLLLVVAADEADVTVPPLLDQFPHDDDDDEIFGNSRELHAFETELRTGFQERNAEPSETLRRIEQLTREPSEENPNWMAVVEAISAAFGFEIQEQK